MLNLVSITLIFLSVTTSVYCRKRYDNYKVFRIAPSSNEQTALLQTYAKLPGNSFWVRPSGTSLVDLQLAPNYVNDFQQAAWNMGMKAQVFVDDVQALIEDEQAAFVPRAGHEAGSSSHAETVSRPSGVCSFRRAPTGAQESPGGSSGGGSFRTSNFDTGRYNTLEDINNWLEYLENTHDTVLKISGGRTYQNREIEGVRLRFGVQKPGVFIEGGIHGREWLTTATAINLIDRLLNSQDQEVREMAEAYDWYIFPVCNPDGYVYTHVYDRLWQKTLSDTGSGPDPSDPNCKGVDLNGNFGYKWQEHGEDVDEDPCHDWYPGTHPFSEVESKSLSDFIETLRGKLLAYISIQSYSQFLLLPFDYTSQHLENYHDAFSIGSRAISALNQKYGAQYRIGNRAEMTYGVVSGTTMDWAKGCMGLELVYTYKMRNYKKFGFLVPQNYISRNSEEFLTSLITLFEQARALGYPKNKSIGKFYFPGGQSSGPASMGCIKKKRFKLPRCFGGTGR